MIRYPKWYKQYKALVFLLVGLRDRRTWKSQNANKNIRHIFDILFLNNLPTFAETN